MPFVKVEQENQRLCLLRSINDYGGAANESIIQDCLDLYAHHLSRDSIRTHLTWLKEQGLVELDDISGCYIARLTDRGFDVVEGRSAVPGVKRVRRGA